ncbi:MAG: Peptidyl-tRNA hydrolase [Candidatus Gottesmanbacteria bacterium GW2011_GWC2_39_8]|uniref:Peptidyl-tRNA hydrolase n=1 Tax=Candidatus Gottesmanbacteria bacterium GW2011_GWC2_39_8 TaxID=1618450 RepID=A0A0G0T643_9BACT|nr:MAG: Peptidyl-tRNA hydrolase [Candidatus Gottesmanbacteria bacterium GW2011_GWC2_39_8]
MKLIVGLGNPGVKYESTRHNIGFMVIDELLNDLTPKKKSVWTNENKYQGKMVRIDDLLLLKPQTYMNRSGGSVALVKNFYKIEFEDIIVLNDDIDLPLGKIRIRKGGASAGHNGVKSIIDHLASPEFIRVRFGIGRGMLSLGKSDAKNMHRQSVEQYVVSLFYENEAGEARKMIKRGVEAVETLLKDGLEKAMNKFN